MKRITSYMTTFVRWFPLVLTIIACLLSGYSLVNDGPIDQAIAIVGAAVSVSLLFFLVYGRTSWTVYTDGTKIKCRKFRKNIETDVSNIRNIELFPDIIFKGRLPQYVLNLKKPVGGVGSIRFYPAEDGSADKLVFEPWRARLRKSASERRSDRSRR